MSGHCPDCGNTMCMCAEVRAQEMRLRPIVTLTIPGRVAILKNSKRVIARGRGLKALVLPSARYAQWEQHSMVAVKNAFKGHLVDWPCRVHFKFYFANRQSESDLSNCLGGPEDLLQRAGILKDDKLIMELWARKYFGHEPRVEIEIFKHETEERK